MLGILPQQSDKALRQLLYGRQRKLFNLREGFEDVALPGDLIRVNPHLLTTVRGGPQSVEEWRAYYARKEAKLER